MYWAQYPISFKAPSFELYPERKTFWDCLSLTKDHGDKIKDFLLPLNLAILEPFLAPFLAPLF